MIPEIVTDRLRLRAHRMEDLAASAAMWADRSVTRFIGGRPAIEDLASGDFVGEAEVWLSQVSSSDV